jgi:pilus assembly protein CpaE
MSAISISKRPAGNASEQDQEPFAAYLTDEKTAATLVSIVAEQGWSEDRIYSGGIANAVRSLAAVPSPLFLVVDISQSSDPRADMNALGNVCEQGTVLVAIGTVNDVALYRDLAASGVQEYLLKPVATEDLRDAVLSAVTSLEDPAEAAESGDTRHPVTAIIGVRGGVGASTITTSCAWVMSHQLNRNTAILDLDLQFGTTALSFDLEPGRGLCDALENPSRVDSLFIDRATVKHGARLSILGAEAALSDILYPDPEAISHLMRELQQNFEAIIIDLPRNILVGHPHILADLDELFLVTDLSLAAARDTIRLLAFATKLAPELKISIVANSVKAGSDNEVSLDDFKKSIEKEFDWVIPHDRRATLEATKQGMSLPQGAPESKVVTEIESIARHICGIDEEKAGPASFFSRILGGKEK